MPVFRPGPVTTSRSTSGWTATMSSVRWTPSSAGASDGSVFVASAVTAGAAHMITGKQVVNGSLTGADVKTGSLTGSDVKNGSIGRYAEAVQREEYRDAKLRTILDTLPEVLGPEGKGLDLRWAGPGESEHSSGAVILVSNNRYRLGRAVGSGTRPRIDDGLLGIAVASAPDKGRPLIQRPWQEWTTPAFEVDADGPIAAGIDGEAVILDAPLRFRILPATLRVRIAAAHPGASPSAAIPEDAWETVRALARIAATGTPKQHRASP